MGTDPSPCANPSRRIALLIDADNISHTNIDSIISELSKYGTANIRRAYGNWANPGLKGWTEKLHGSAIRPMQQFSYSVRKNATDMALVIDAMELLYSQKPDAYCIASSDGDFTPLVMQLKANGHDVYGFGERKAPEAFVSACTTFLYLDSLPDPEAAASSPALDKPKPKDASTKDQVAVALKKKLSSDTKLLTALRGGVQAVARDDGWAMMGAVGNAVKRQAPIDPRNYGLKNFPALYEAIGQFDFFRAENGQAYVADKRNKERAARPLI